jgi:DNA-binding CsgD family transcriptional regulator
MKDVLDASASLAELERSLAALIAMQGIQYYSFQGRFTPASPDGLPNGPDVTLANAPAGWKDFYSGSALADDSPFAAHLKTGSAPVPWQELKSNSAGFFDKASSFGLVSGVTHIVHGAGGARSLMSYMWGTAGDDIEARIDASIAMGQLLACYTHDAVQRLVRSEAKTPSKEPAQINLPALTPRQRQCLSLAATGHTALQIAGSLSISQRAVGFHLNNARQRLGVKNSRQAYVKALSMGLISHNY